MELKWGGGGVGGGGVWRKRLSVKHLPIHYSCDLICKGKSNPNQNPRNESEEYGTAHAQAR